jgi:DNA-binding beta-propeller fold protein YncE
MVRSGTLPVVGATVSVYAAGLPSALGQATSAGDGTFAIPLAKTPATGTVIYFIARGGNAGAGAQPATALLAVAGAWCDAASGCAFPATVSIDGLTTVAAAYALAGFLHDDGAGPMLSGTDPGLANALVGLGNLVGTTGGEIAPGLANLACTGTGEPVNCEALRKLDTLASVLAACVQAGSSAATACTGLMQAADGASDTLTAILRIASDPAVREHGAAVFDLLSAAPTYMPVLAAAPNDWTLALTFTGGGLYQPTGVAVDAAGNVWAADYSVPGAVSEFTPAGIPLSGSSGFTGGGLAGPTAVAIDAAGNAWVADWDGGNGKTISELGPDGTPLSGSGGFSGGGLLGPVALAVTPQSILWVANFGNSTLSWLTADGQVSGPFSGGGLNFPVAIGVDAPGDVWVANQSGNSVSEFNPAGTPLAAAYTGGGLTEPAGLALDPAGNVWVSDFATDAISELVGGDTPSASCPATPGTGATGCPRSPAGGYTGGGLAGPDGLAVDALGRVFITNFHGNSLTELAGTGAALSPAGGYTSRGLAQPYGLAIDAAGNVWVSDFATGALTEFLGLAAPVKTPLIGPPSPP